MQYQTKASNGPSLRLAIILAKQRPSMRAASLITKTITTNVDLTYDDTTTHNAAFAFDSTSTTTARDEDDSKKHAPRGQQPSKNLSKDGHGFSRSEGSPPSPLFPLYRSASPVPVVAFERIKAGVGPTFRVRVQGKRFLAPRAATNSPRQGGPNANKCGPKRCIEEYETE